MSLNIKKIMKSLTIVSIISVFFMSLNVPIIKTPVNITNIMLGVIFIINLLMFPKKIINFIYSRTLSKKRPLYYLVIYVIYSLISSLSVIAFVLGIDIPYIMWDMLLFICVIFFPIVYWNHLILKYITSKKLYKIIILGIYFVLIMGIYDVVVHMLNIQPLINIVEYCHTRWYLIAPEFYKIAYVGNIQRMQSIFDEPSHVGWFILIVSPIIYSYCFNSFKLFKTKFLDTFIKITIMPLMCIDLIWCLSPMMLIFTLLITLIYFYKQIILHLKKHIKLNLIILLCLLIFSINIADTNSIFRNNKLGNDAFHALERVTNVVKAKSFQEFVIIEQSFAVRVCLAINDVYLWSKHPIFGVGIGHIYFYGKKQIDNSPVPLPLEIIEKNQTGKHGMSYYAYLLKVLCEGGIIGFAIFILFMFKLYKYTSKAFLRSYGYDRYLLQGLKYSLLSVYILLFYDIPITNMMIWFILGTSLAISERVIKKQYCIKRICVNEQK